MKILALAICAILVDQSVHEENGELAALHARIDQLEQHVSACSPSQPSGRAGWFASLEYLNWKAHRPYVPYSGTLAYEYQSDQNMTFQATRVNLIETEYPWDSGFRESVGYITARQWEVAFQYTYFRTSVYDAVGSRGGSRVYAPRALSFNRSFATSGGETRFASEDTAIDYDVYDAVVARTCLLDHGFSWRPFAGLRFAELEHRSHVLYSNPQAAEGSTVDIDASTALNGAGLRIGNDIFWHLADSRWSLFASGSGTLMGSRFKSRRIDTSAFNRRVHPQISVQDTEDTFTKAVPVAEISAGLQCDFGWLSFGAGYELVYWFDAFQHLNDSTSLVNAMPLDDMVGDLSFDGWFLRAKIFY